MKTFLVFLKEELNDKQKKQVDKWAADAPHHSFADHVFNDKSRSVNIPLQTEKPETQKKIEGHLLVNGFKVHDYNAGIAKDKHGRDVKIGKALVKTKAPKDLVDQFANREKSTSNAEGHYIRISGHPHDVGAMSTGQKWDSCMNLDHGEFKLKVKNAIHEGTHVAYLMHKDHKAPISRINLVPFQNENGHKILRPEGSTYGSDNHEDKFRNSVRAWSEEHFPAQSKTLYEKSSKIYDDDGNTYVISNDKETADHFVSNPTKIKMASERDSVMNMIMKNHPGHHMTFFQKHADSILYTNTKHDVLRENKEVAHYAYNKAMNGTKEEKRHYNEEYMDTILTHHKDIAEHHFENNILPKIKRLKAKRSKSGILSLERQSDHNLYADSNSASTHKSIAKALLDHKVYSDRIADNTLNHPSLHKELFPHLENAEKDKMLRKTDLDDLKNIAANEHESTAMHLLEKKDKAIHLDEVLHHPKIAAMHINHKDEDVRARIAAHHQHLSHHFLNDESSYVQRQALRHKKTVHSVLNAPEVSKPHLDHIVKYFEYHPDIIKKAMTHPSMHKSLPAETLIHHFSLNHYYDNDDDYSPYHKKAIARFPENPVRSKAVRAAVLSHPGLIKGNNKHKAVALKRLFNSVEQDQD